MTRILSSCIALSVLLSGVLAAGCSGEDPTSPSVDDDELTKQAQALHCVNHPYTPNTDWTFTLDATVASATELRKVSMTAFSKDWTPATETGTSAKELANPNYKAVKYKNSNQFNLSLEGKDGKAFLPLDSCEFQVVLPNDIRSRKAGTEFEGRLMYHCDQNGGSTAYYCSVK